MPIQVTPIFNSTTPAAPDGYRNVKPQSDGGNPLALVSFYANASGGAVVKTGDYTAQASDSGYLIVMNSGSPPSTLKLPLGSPPSPPFPEWCIFVANEGSADLTIDPNGLELDGSSATLALPAGQGIYIATDGSNYYSSRGMGSGGGSGFTAGGDLSGTSSSQTVIGLEGKPLDAATVGSPSDGQVIQYESSSGKYKAATLSVGSAAEQMSYIS